MLRSAFVVATLALLAVTFSQSANVPSEEVKRSSGISKTQPDIQTENGFINVSPTSGSDQMSSQISKNSRISSRVYRWIPASISAWRRADLTGRYISPKQQCFDRRPGYFTNVCEVKDPAEICKELMCASDAWDIPWARRTGPALNGTWCGDNKICFKGLCIDDEEPLENPLKIIDGEMCEY